MIYKAVILFLQKFLWSKFIKGRIISKIWFIAGFGLILFFAGAFVSSLLFQMTFEDGLWLVWSYIGEGAKEITRVLLS